MSDNIKRLARYLLDRSFGPFCYYTMGWVQACRHDTALYDLAFRKAIESSVEYAEKNMQSALIFKKRVDLWDYALEKVSLAGTCAEFGVWAGKSINHFASRLPNIYGFDSFEGLKEDWRGWGFPRGSFDLQGKMPKVARNVSLVKGWFNETLPEFLANHPEPFSFIHIDCDTFESTSIVLDLVGSRLVPGTG